MSGKSAIITGTSSGIGKAAVLKYLDAGFRVYGLDIAAPSVVHKNFIHFTCDVSDKSALPDLPDVVTVINNAGVSDDSSSIRVNLEGYINVAEKYCFQPAIQSVVNVGSLSGRAGMESIRYCASQGGRISLTKWLAVSLGNKYKARVNCISFGAVLTGFEPDIYKNRELMEAVANENLLRRWISPEEAAEWIYFVAEINKSMTGQEILVDCGEEANYNFISPQ